MMRLSCVSLFAVLSACGTASEKICAAPVEIEISENGTIAVSEKTIEVETLDAELAAASAACGGKLDVLLTGYGRGDRATTEAVLARLGESDHVGSFALSPPQKDKH